MTPFPPVGTTCVTSKGVLFQRVNDPSTEESGWQDLSASGKIWFDSILLGVHPTFSEQICDEKTGQKVPTRKDFWLAETNGLSEVLPDMRDKFMWVASVDRDARGEYVYYRFREDAPWEAHVGRVRFPKGRFSNDFGVRCVNR